MTPRTPEWWKQLLRNLEADLTRPGEGRDSQAWNVLQDELRLIAITLLQRHQQDLPSEVDDLVQDVLLRLQSVRTLRRVRAAGSAEGYLAVLMRNRLRDRLRRELLEERWRRSAKQAIRDRGAPPEDLITLRRFISGLDPASRQLLHMRFWRDLSIREIAEELGEKYSTVSVRLFRLLRRLESLMEA